MSETNAMGAATRPTVVTPATSAKPVASKGQQGHTWLEGRITESRQVGVDREQMPIFETILTIPAVDKYSYPSRFCITSRSRLGRDGEDLLIEVEVQCRPWRDGKGRWHYPHSLWVV